MTGASQPRQPRNMNVDIKTAGVSIPAAGAKALSPHTFQSTPLLSKQGTPEASPDTQEPEPPERVAHVPAVEGLRTKGRHSETVAPAVWKAYTSDIRGKSSR